MNVKLRQLRHARGLTLKEVSSALGITLGAYSNYEQGNREPSLEMLRKLCDFFDVSADYLIGRSDNY